MYREFQPEEISELLKELELASQKTGKGKAQKRVYKILDSDKSVVSWKFNEWDYGREKIRLPSDARGLFTLEGEEKLVVRGYDKFFNIGEVSYTRWDWLENKTEGPYQVTLKENGCIILISGLEDGTIVVCSKHSTGSRDDIKRNHAIAGQKFLESQLSQLGIDIKEFALKLYEMNVTAVAEYCDDTFEEHIVEYKGDTIGLYLHGLNLNQPVFETLPVDKVHDFALKYGFKPVDFFEEKDIANLRKTLEECSKTGSFNGKDAEGFVIRCKLNDEKKHDYFFKFKFEEPYLMFRQWREVTKEYISHKRRGDIKFTKHKFITNNYLDFAIPLLDSDESLRNDILNGYGIIELRTKFLEFYGKTGSEILNQELLEELDAVNALQNLKLDENTKFVFVPVATIGCGKTTTALTLIDLFKESWDIVINDDLPYSKNTKIEFIKKALEKLQNKDVVFLDRNNHQYRERKQIFDDFRALRDTYISHNLNVQFVCLNFIKDDSNSSEVWDLTTKRVIARGDNHQSIKAVSDGEAKVKGIMKGFVNRFQSVEPSKKPDSDFDLVITLDATVDNSSLKNAEKILQVLHETYPVLVKNIPTNDRLQTSFNKALEFKPTYLKTRSSEKPKSGTKEKIGVSTKERKTKKEVKRSPVFFSIDLDGTENLLYRIDELLSIKKEYGECILSKLKENKRVQDEFHVTLAHVNQGKKGTESEKQIWKEYQDYYTSHPPNNKDSKLGVLASIKLKKLIWNEKALAVLVEPLKFEEKGTGEELELSVANKFPHITVGTASEDIKPFYSNELAELASHHSEEGVYQDITILNFENTTLESLPVKVNF